eukprot:GFUD01002849.1.p1 GENE.GFUD01002849.1~~GFUD01002849.1.p1  ORF type:complete len:542 (+),score=83.31 GFUD01002849.1:251-1876(+)
MKLEISLTLYLVNLLTCARLNLIREAPFATLEKTIKTNNRSACDGEILHIDCPTGTKISIQHVLYELRTCNQEYSHEGMDGFTCNIKEAIRTVEEICESKESCSIITSGKYVELTLQDPCPGVRKYVEIAYKCMPTTFVSKVLCRGESLSLTCSEPDKNIAVFSSSFQSVAAGPAFCPLISYVNLKDLEQSKDEGGRIMNECEVTHAITRLCHGVHSCNVTANTSLLGATACHKEHVILKISYSCMTRQNFLPQFLKKVVQAAEVSKFGSKVNTTTEEFFKLMKNVAIIDQLKLNNTETEFSIIDQVNRTAIEFFKLMNNVTDKPKHNNTVTEFSIIGSKVMSTSNEFIKGLKHLVKSDISNLETKVPIFESTVNTTASKLIQVIDKLGKVEKLNSETTALEVPTFGSTVNTTTIQFIKVLKPLTVKADTTIPEASKQDTTILELSNFVLKTNKTTVAFMSTEENSNDDIMPRIISGLNQNFQAVQNNRWKLLVVLTLSTGLGITCFLIIIVTQLCQMYQNEPPDETPSHVNLSRSVSSLL